jgi:hypothetical protein
MLALVASLSACGDDDGGPLDLGPDLSSTDLATVDLAPTDLALPPAPPDLAGADLVGYPAPHQPFPVVEKHAGGIVRQVRLVTVTYDDYLFRAHMEEWGDFVFGSQWLKAVGAEYGVEGGSQVGRVHLPGPAPETVTANDLLDTINTLIDSGKAPAPIDSQNEQVVYLVYLPHETRLDDGHGGVSCRDYFGYHITNIHGGILYPFAFVMDCNTAAADVQATAAHELIESATDPYGFPREGYFIDVMLPSHYFTEALGEVADLCNEEEYFWEAGHAMPPSWSNAAAQEGKEPCVPSTSWPFYGVDVQPATAPTVAPGAQVQFTLTGWAMFPRADWGIGALETELSDFSASEMSATLSSKKLNNGTSVTLTLTVPATAKPGQIGAVDVYSTEITTRRSPASFVVQ